MLWLLVVSLTTTASAWAHTVGISRGEWRVDGASLGFELSLSRTDALTLAPWADADADGELSVSEVAAEGVAGRVVDQYVRVHAAGVPCRVGHAELGLVEEDGALLAASFRCSSGAPEVDLSGYFAALPPGHRQASFVHRSSGDSIEALLHVGSARLGLGVGDATQPATHGLRVAVDYLVLGVEHIVFGFDHVVFLLGLVLVRARVRDVVAMATAFTVAHSITLALAVLGFVAPSGALIEPLIALSVAYVGVENLRGVEARTRWRVTAAFGLVHGFGFAGALADVGLPSERVPLALLSFNLGVELGQLAILAAVVPLLVHLHGRAWFRDRGVRVLSALLVVVGLAWFVERVLA